jgi:DNA-binding NtrC family response regulator
LLRRMESFVIRVPALRERREDIGLLLLHALHACVDSAEELAAFPAALVSDMCNYDWPGNIRQLANVARRAVMAQRAGQVVALAQFVREPFVSRSVIAGKQDATSPSASKAAPRRSLASIGHDDVLQAMEDNAWQISGAAQQLGISRPSLYKLIEAHPAIRPAALIPPTEISAAARACGGDIGLCASHLKTPAEALRRHLRVADPALPGL